MRRLLLSQQPGINHMLCAPSPLYWAAMTTRAGETYRVYIGQPANRSYVISGTKGPRFICGRESSQPLT